MRSLIITCALAAVAFSSVTACGSDQKQVEDPYLPPDDESKEPVVGPAPECVDEEGEQVRCEDDKECCKGFVCGIDPELSSRIKYSF